MKNIELNHKLNAGHLKSLSKRLGLMVDRIDSPLGFNESVNCVEFFGEEDWAVELAAKRAKRIMLNMNKRCFFGL